MKINSRKEGLNSKPPRGKPFSPLGAFPFTHLLQDGCNIRMIQELLEHENVGLRMYTHVLCDERKR